MTKIVKDTIHAKGIDIGIYTSDFRNEYISLTDIAKYKSDSPDDVIKNWMRNRDTIEFLGLWESMNNPNFKPVEFDGFKKEAGANAFTMSPKKWVDSTNAMGIAKLNYRVHTDSIKDNLIPPSLTSTQVSRAYASEADLLNVILFGKIAKQWREENIDKQGNIREEATIYQLLVLANMESYNAILIKQGKSQAERMKLLHELAVQQMTTLSKLDVSTLPGIEKKDDEV